MEIKDIENRRKEYKLYCLNNVYISFAILYSFLYYIVPFDNFLSLPIWKIAYYGLGALVIFYNVFIRKSYMQVRYYVFLFLFMISYAITTFVNVKIGYIRSIQDMFYLFLSLFVFLSMGGQMDGKYIKKQFHLFSNIIILIWNLGVIWSIWRFLTGYSAILSIRNMNIIQGFYEARLFGVFTDPNIASLNSVAIIWLALIILNSAKNRFTKFSLKGTIVLQFLYIILSNSRTSKMVFLVTLICAVWFFEKSKSVVYKATFRVMLNTIVVVGIVIMCWQVCEKVLPIIANSIQMVYEESKEANKVNISSDDNVKNNESIPQQNVSLERMDTKKNDISNNRFTIWRSALEVFKQNAFWGTTSGYMLSVAKKTNPDTYIVQRGYMLHNGYLEILVFSGIAGMLSMMSFFVATIFELIYKIKKIPLKQKYYFVLNLLIPVEIAIGFLTLSGFYGNSATTMLFWLYTGFLIKSINIIQMEGVSIYG